VRPNHAIDRSENLCCCCCIQACHALLLAVKYNTSQWSQAFILAMRPVA